MKEKIEDTLHTEALHVAIVLAAGKGSRMNSDIPKQYLLLKGKPLVCHCLDTLEASPCIDQVVLVVGRGEVDYVRSQIIEAYSYQKVSAVLEGGAERYHSVSHALEYLDGRIPEASYVYIHDGARPYLEEALLERLYRTVRKEGACIAAVPVKDTIKQVDKNGRIKKTPERSSLWMAQTPQVFPYVLIWEAYRRMLAEGKTEGITDDAQVVERMGASSVKIVEGSYRNQKITTPEDIDP